MADGIGRVDDYLLHKPPMRLVEELIEGNEQGVTTALTVGAESPFFSGELQGVPGWVGLEYMAQTAAVWVGMEAVRQHRPVELGFLVSARQYRAQQPIFPIGSRLIVTISRQFGEESIVVFEGTIRDQQGKDFAKANFTAYQPDDVNAYLRGEIQ